jgi:hypothetical protein
MRSKELNLARYRTDKIANDYLRWYDPLLADRVETVRHLLELGVHRGGSLELWRDYFPHAEVVGIDSDLSLFQCSDPARIQVFPGSQTDTKFLRTIADQVAPDGFDLIIDDASHFAVKSEISFWCLFEDHLKPGAIYVIEDWGTGYLADWPDGRQTRKPARATHLGHVLSAIGRRLGIVQPIRSHTYGMVGLVKKLIDELGNSGLSVAQRNSRIAEIIITPAFVAIRKH